jgi:hypothetical protein
LSHSVSLGPQSGASISTLYALGDPPIDSTDFDIVFVLFSTQNCAPISIFLNPSNLSIDLTDLVEFRLLIPSDLRLDIHPLRS